MKKSKIKIIIALLILSTIISFSIKNIDNTKTIKEETICGKKIPENFDGVEKWFDELHSK